MEPKIGLALGAGGARGFAHIGAIQVLEKNNIPIDFIAGCSIGSLVGALYSMGHDGETLERFASLFRHKFYFDFMFPKMGFIAGSKVKELIHLLTQGKKIEDLAIPLSIVAVDLHTGEKVIFRDGNIADAVRASISIPGVFVPENINGRYFVDGSVVDRVPVSVVKEMGADVIIAVDVFNLKTKPQITTIVDVILQSLDIMQNEMVRYHEIKTDIIIRPDLGNYSLHSFEHANELIQLGKRETEKQLTNIEKAIENWKESHA
ncbi:esterase [Pueribacillus theae]|uniref:Esterase n=1 Tax=Pueribacillus theae TaxID=2171751 RepID=A0A2U1K782_9BACI|nr:patatin-like phospholipase family protein [Pueribacillus theae]PWA13391.1 esterase [Pueribacillus theae]